MKKQKINTDMNIAINEMRKSIERNYESNDNLDDSYLLMNIKNMIEIKKEARKKLIIKNTLTSIFPFMLIFSGMYLGVYFKNNIINQDLGTILLIVIPVLFTFHAGKLFGYIWSDY